MGVPEKHTMGPRAILLGEAEDTATKGSPSSPQLERAQQQRPSAAKRKMNCKTLKTCSDQKRQTIISLDINTVILLT